jgi:hypothetical protein
MMNRMFSAGSGCSDVPSSKRLRGADDADVASEAGVAVAPVLTSPTVAYLIANMEQRKSELLVNQVQLITPKIDSDLGHV